MEAKLTVKLLASTLSKERFVDSPSLYEFVSCEEFINKILCQIARRFD